MYSKVLDILEFNKIISKLKNYSETDMGRELITKLSPIFDLEQIKYLQEETSEAVTVLSKGIKPSFSPIKDIRFSLNKAIKGSILAPEEFLNISDTLRGFRKVKKVINEKDERFKCHIIDKLNSQILLYDFLENRINECIIGENEIADKASKELFYIRKNLRIKSESVKDKLSDIINSPKYKKILQEPIVTIRNERYVVPVKQEYKADFPGIVHDQSSSGATFFIEPMPVVYLNNEIRELLTKERREIEKILKELTIMVAQESESINNSLSVIAQLDYIFAKANMSLDMDGVQPFLNSDGYVNIKQARHPLLTGEIVPIDISFGKDYNILVITGPNTGGKTVTLKTVGLLTLMAQSGLHVPAKWGTELAVFDYIYADIGDEQSIEQNLSTFSSHMINIVNILNNIKTNSLVLLDELGAGTDPVEGAALAMAILEFLYEKKIRVIATTHYSELKTFAYIREGFKNASVEFDVETLKPTYRLILGLPGKSNAFEIAGRLGLSDIIIRNAKKFMKKEDINMEDLIRDIHYNINIARVEREEAEKGKTEVEKIKEEYLKKINNIENRREQILKQARKEALSIVETAISKSETIIKEIKELKLKQEIEKNKIIFESKKKLNSMRLNIKGSLTEPILKHAENNSGLEIKSGDRVSIRGLNQKGYVIEKLNNDEIMVQIGMIKMTVPITAVAIIRNKTEGKIEGIGKISMEKANSIASEIDVRGKTLQEALEEVDKYIDDAYLAGLSKVTLIHGKGTGVLREGLQEFLKNNRLINSYRLGRYNEGGNGVTIVELSR